jgi:hypothetical protein
MKSSLGYPLHKEKYFYANLLRSGVALEQSTVGSMILELGHVWSSCLVLTFLSLTTRMVRTATTTEMLASAYKHRRWVHTSSNGAKGRRG